MAALAERAPTPVPVPVEPSRMTALQALAAVLPPS